MPTPTYAIAVARLFVLRGAVTWVLLRLTLLVVEAILRAIAGSGAPALDASFGLVLIVAALGEADVRRRRERILWADFGMPRLVPIAVFGSVAAAGELLIALVTR